MSHAPTTLHVPAHYYQQFDADYERDVPAEACGGWNKTTAELAPERTAIVVMHAWETGSPERYPGWHRAVEFLTRSKTILQTVFPPLLAAVRQSNVKLYHLTSGSYYCKDYPGYQRTAALAGPTPPPERIDEDPLIEKLRAFKRDHAYVGEHNQADTGRGFQAMRFPPEAEPRDDEPIAENAHQLFAQCKADGVTHLIYTGFAINWCLLMSSGGMVDMSRHGLMCSAVRQAVTALENRETARHELAKEVALWRVAVQFGFVFDADDLIAAIHPRA